MAQRVEKRYTTNLGCIIQVCVGGSWRPLDRIVYDDLTYVDMYIKELEKGYEAVRVVEIKEGDILYKTLER